MFFLQLPGHRAGYPLPTHGGDVAAIYVRRIRVVFLLTDKDGVSDWDFYAR